MQDDRVISAVNVITVEVQAPEQPLMAVVSSEAVLTLESLRLTSSPVLSSSRRRVS
jgi:hypothetical protein